MVPCKHPLQLRRRLAIRLASGGKGGLTATRRSRAVYEARPTLELRAGPKVPAAVLHAQQKAGVANQQAWQRCAWGEQPAG